MRLFLSIWDLRIDSTIKDKICHSHVINVLRGMGLACNKFMKKLFDNIVQSTDHFLTIHLDLRQHVKVTVTKKQYATLSDPKCTHIPKCGISTSNNKEDVLLTQFTRAEVRIQGHSDLY